MHFLTWLWPFTWVCLYKPQRNLYMTQSISALNTPPPPYTCILYMASLVLLLKIKVVPLKPENGQFRLRVSKQCSCQDRFYSKVQQEKGYTSTYPHSRWWECRPWTPRGARRSCPGPPSPHPTPPVARPRRRSGPQSYPATSSGQLKATMEFS